MGSVYRCKIFNEELLLISNSMCSVLGKFDYYKEQGNLHELTKVAINDKYVVDTSVNSWFEKYIDWAVDNKEAKYFNDSK